MKRIFSVLILFIAIKASPQSVIEPYPLQITTGKTTNIIFAGPIISVDRGTSAVLVQKARNVENILHVKADSPFFKETNLSVVLLGGKLFSFAVSYADEPEKLNLSFQNDSTTFKRKNFLHVSTTNEELKLTLKNIYITNHSLSFSFQLNNYSQIDFEPKNITFYIKDSKRSKRTAIQEIPIIPLNKVHCPTVSGNKKNSFEAEFNLFTISKHKRFVCEVSDPDNERVLILHIKHKKILQARIAE
ncbi:MAG: DUF4138 domain-containing protein [Bacteroidetes bacterium]|nr:DUF4138 domain-containing protein [Bacteroidota bacterium]